MTRRNSRHCRLATLIVLSIAFGLAAAPNSPAADPQDRDYRYAYEQSEQVVVAPGNGTYGLRASQALEEDILQQIASRLAVTVDIHCEDPAANRERRNLAVEGASFAELISKARGKPHTLVYRDARGKAVENPTGATWKKVAVVDAYPANCAPTGPVARRFADERSHPALSRGTPQPSVNELAAIVKAEGPATRRAALNVLAHSDEPAATAVVRGSVDDPNPTVMLIAARALAAQARRKGTSTEAAAVLARRFKQDPYLDLVPLLASLDRQQAWPAIEQLTRVSDKKANDVAVRALAVTLDARGLPWLTQVAAKADRATAEQASVTIGKIGGREAVEALTELLTSPDEERRAVALAGIAALPEADRATLNSKVVELLKRGPLSKDIYAVLAGRQNLQPLKDLLADPQANAKSKMSALEAIASEGSERGVNAMSAALRDPRPDVRQAAATALGSVVAVEATTNLVEAAKDQSPDVRAQAAWGLGRLETDEVVDTLGTLVRDPDPKVRKSAIEALDNLGKPNAAGIKILQEARNSSDPYVAKRAAELLRYWQGEK